MSPLARLRALAAKNAQKLRFLVAGGVNTLVGNAVFPLLVWTSPWLNRRYMIALVIAQATSLIFAFINYKVLVFRTRGNIVREFMKFAALYVPLFAVNYAALPFLVEVVRLDRVTAQLCLGTIAVVGSYFWNGRVTFRDRRA